MGKGAGHTPGTGIQRYKGSARQFKKGEGGRPKGAKSKGVEAREAFVETYWKIGGPKKCAEWALKNDRNLSTFYRIFGGLLPKEVHHSGEEGDTLHVLLQSLVVPVDTSQFRNPDLPPGEVVEAEEAVTLTEEPPALPPRIPKHRTFAGMDKHSRATAAVDYFREVEGKEFRIKYDNAGVVHGVRPMAGGRSVRFAIPKDAPKWRKIEHWHDARAEAKFEYERKQQDGSG